MLHIYKVESQGCTSIPNMKNDVFLDGTAESQLKLRLRQVGIREQMALGN